MKRLLTLLVLVLAFVLAQAQQAHADQTQAPATKQAITKTHWLTIKSGIRHNSNCRYFKNSKGRMCTKDEGRACKICGG